MLEWKNCQWKPLSLRIKTSVQICIAQMPDKPDANIFLHIILSPTIFFHWNQGLGGQGKKLIWNGSPNEQRSWTQQEQGNCLCIFSFSREGGEKERMELWTQWGNLWEMQVVWFRQLEGVLKDFRRWADSFLINEGALTPDPLNSLWLEGYSALSFDWKHEPVTYELAVAFLLIASGGKGQEDSWRRGRKRWVAKKHW